jgi:hypothetical protein
MHNVSQSLPSTSLNMAASPSDLLGHGTGRDERNSEMEEARVWISELEKEIEDLKSEREEVQ